MLVLSWVVPASCFSTKVLLFACTAALVEGIAKRTLDLLSILVLPLSVLANAG